MLKQTLESMRLAACLACSAMSSAETGRAGALLQGPQVTVFFLPSFFSIVVGSSWHWVAGKEPACNNWGTGAPGHLERLVVFPGRLSLLSCCGRFKVATVLSSGSTEVSQRNGSQGRVDGDSSRGEATVPLAWESQLEV